MKENQEPRAKSQDFHAKFMIYISEEYFEKATTGFNRHWEKIIPEEKAVFRKATTCLIDAILASNGMFTPPEGIEIVPIHPKSNV